MSGFDRRQAVRLFTGAALASPVVLSRRASAAAQFNYKLGHPQPTTHPVNIRLQEAVDKIQQQSGGRLVFRLFPNAMLGGDTEMLSQTRTGALEMFMTSGLIVQTLVPLAGVNGIGFAFKTYDQVWRAMDGRLGALIRAAMLKSNIVAMDKIWDNGFRQTTTIGKPIRQPEDLRGVKIRVPMMPLMTSLFETFGAAPAGINIKDAYTSLQLHVVDAQENPLTQIYNFRFYEVQKFCSLTNHVWDGFWGMANRRSWEALPDDLREIAARNFNDAATLQRQDIERLNNSLQTDLGKAGIVFNTVDPEPFRSMLSKSGFYKTWKAKFGEEAWTALEEQAGALS
jgi:TRAP-type transport system periplasmic protein